MSEFISNVITDREQFFDELKPWDKFYIVGNCNVTTARFISMHPYIKDRVIVANDNNYTTISSFLINDESKVILSAYDSIEVGTLILSQLEDKIQHVKDVYIAGAENF